MTTVTVTFSVALADTAPAIPATRWEQVALDAAKAVEGFVRERAARRMAAVVAEATRAGILAETRDAGRRAAVATGAGMTRGC
jgi:hypothetical protein